MEEKNIASEQEVNTSDLLPEEEQKNEEVANNARKEEKATTENPAPEKKQSREDNARFAEMRRKEKADHLAEIERVKKETEFNIKKDYVSADAKEALGLEQIENDDELFLAQEYEKAQQDGVENPAVEAYKHLYAKHKQERLDEAAKTKAEEDNIRAIAEEQSNFQKEFGISTRDAYLNTDFQEKYGEFISDQMPGSITKAYRIYLKNKGKVEEAAKSKGNFNANPNNSGEASAVDYVKLAKENPEEFMKVWRK